MWNFGQLPILQAPTGSIAGPELCAAVAAAGGMGAMGLTWTEPEVARGYVREVLSKLANCDSANSFQVNFVLHFEPLALIPVLEEGAPVITFSWGMPDSYVELVRSFGAKFGVQIVNSAGAKRALDIGADFLVCQGVEAGGHVQSSTPLWQLLPEVLQVAGDTPVVAAGGLADGADIAGVLKAGAGAAMLGTRFVATVENRAHSEYKRALVDASQTALTICFDGGWPNSYHRVVKNRTFVEWEAAGCPPPGHRPGEGQRLAEGEDLEAFRYDGTAPRAGMSGNIAEMCLYSGAGVAKIRDIPPAKALIERLWSEALGSSKVGT